LEVCFVIGIAKIQNKNEFTKFNFAPRINSANMRAGLGLGIVFVVLVSLIAPLLIIRFEHVFILLSP